MIVSKTEAAKRLGISQALVTRRIKQGKLTVVGDKVDLSVPPESSDETYAQAQTRREIALADKYELENEVRNGELIGVTEAATLWATAAQKVRDPLLALPDEAAPILAALTDVRQIRDELGNRIRQILSNLSIELHESTSHSAA